MQFTCAHIFRGFSPTLEQFDVSFLEFPPINPKRYFEMRSKVSRVFDSSSDKILKTKKDENKLGIY